MTTPEEKHYLKSNRKLIFFFQIGKITYIGILGKSFQYSYFVKEISICYHMGCIHDK